MTENIYWLFHNVQQNRKVITDNDSQLARRNYLRSLFSYYEEALSEMREVASKVLVDTFSITGEWKPHEIIPLLDDVPRLSNNVRLTSEPNRIPFLCLVVYTFKVLSKQAKLENEILSDSKWGEFRQSISIRHRILHPKFHTDIDISDEELLSLDHGLAWWVEINRELLSIVV